MIWDEGPRLIASKVIAYIVNCRNAKDLPPNNLKEFVTYAKANSDKLNMAHAEVGSNAFNFGVMLNAVLGVKPTLRWIEAVSESGRDETR